MALLAAACGGGGRGSEPEMRLARLEKADMSIRYVASGHVVSQTVSLSSPDSGVLVKLPVKLDQNVKKGQLIFQIGDEEARQNLRSIQADARGGLQELTQVVVEGGEGLAPGASVRVRP